MKERPILFSAPMVRALLAGTKTQTRRVVKKLPWFDPPGNRWYIPLGQRSFKCDAEREAWQHMPKCCPYGQPGDRLWVRETFMDLGACYLYRADAGAEAERALAAPGQPWKPAIHMPRAASRISLEVTGVRVERLQEISEADAQSEGCIAPMYASDESTLSFAVAYRHLWEAINGPGAWERNPFVWVVEFRRI